uniref:Uncharacterized protein n=1 Tax=Salmonella phage Manna TaxID=3234042 RepID=A0AB39CAI7_9CAUD
MKAYLETIVIAQKEGGDVSTAVSQVILEFPDKLAYDEFTERFDPYEKGPKFEVYRTLLALY